MATTFRLRFDTTGGQPTAEIGIQTIYGEPSRPSLTEPCDTFEQFASELDELRKGLDKIEKEAKEKFSVESPSKKHVQLLKNLGQKNLAKFSRIKTR